MTPLLDARSDAEIIPTTPARNPEPVDENDEENVNIKPSFGIDDGFFATDAHTPPTTIAPRLNPEAPPDVGGGKDMPDANGGVGDNERRNSMPFPTAPGFPGYGITVFTDDEGAPRIIPDVNVYQQKKNLAQGMMDLALISANANQLRYVLESFGRHPYYYFSVTFISISLILQVAVGIGLILNSRYNVKNQDDICKADKINNMTIIGIFLITIVNVFISSFGVADVPRTAW